MQSLRPKTFAECSLSEKIWRAIYGIALIGLAAIGMGSPNIYMSLNYSDKLANSSFSFGILLWCAGLLMTLAFSFAGVFSTLFIYKRLFRMEKEK